MIWVGARALIQRGRIETHARLNKELIPGLVIGVDGKARTDSRQILTDLGKNAAALTPLGGIGEDMARYKGCN